MKNCGLRKAYALGGPIEQMDPTELAQFTNNPDVLNAASTRKWAMEDAAQQAKYPRQKFMNPVGRRDVENANAGLRSVLEQNGMLATTKPVLQREDATGVENLFDKDSLSTYRKQLAYAGGGTVDPEALMREMAAKYGTGGGQPSAPAPAPAPVPAPAPAPQPKPSLLDGLRRIATGNLEGRMKAAGFKQGGTVDGKGYIHGEKGVDKVPAKVAETGEDILVSDGERIVNKKQNAALERLAAEAGMSLDEYLEQSTGEPVGPQMKQGLRAAEFGWNRVHMPGDRVSVDFNPVKPKPDLVKPVEQDPFAFRGGDRGVPGPSNGPDSTALTPVPPVTKPVVPTTLPSVNTDAQEAMRETAMAGLGSQQGLRNAKSMDYLQSMGVDTSKRFAPRDDVNTVNANGPERVRGGAVTTINTQNGPVYAGRDGKGQLVVTSGLDQSDAEQAAATKSGYDQAVAQAQKDKDSLARTQRERAEFDAFDPSITDPAARQNGLRQVAMNMMKDEAAGKALQHKEDRDAMLGLRRDMLEEQRRQFDETASARRDISASAAKERGIQNMEKLFEFSGLKGDRANNFRQFVYQNHADNLSALPHEQQLKVLPRLIADFEDAEIRNANSTNGTSWQNQKVKDKDSLNFEEDAAYDPNGVLDQRVWFGSGADGKGLGKANILLRKYGPTALFGSADVDVMEDGQRVMSKDNRGERGMLGSRQMKEINRLSLRDGDK